MNNVINVGGVEVLDGNNIYLFVNGFADGLTNTDIEDSLESCWSDSSISLNDLETAVQDFKQNTNSSILDGLKALADAYDEI